MTLQENYELAKLTEKILKKGLDYQVTLSDNVKVELIDLTSNKILDTVVEDTLEEALSGLLGRFEQ